MGFSSQYTYTVTGGTFAAVKNVTVTSAPGFLFCEIRVITVPPHRVIVRVREPNQEVLAVWAHGKALRRR